MREQYEYRVMRQPVMQVQSEINKWTVAGYRVHTFAVDGEMATVLLEKVAVH